MTRLCHQLPRLLSQDSTRRVIEKNGAYILQPFWLKLLEHLRLRPSLASLQLSRSDLGLMTAVFEAKFAQAVKTAGCPDDFSKWLISQKLTDYESFGVTAPNEEKLAAEITTVAESNGVKFATIGDKRLRCEAMACKPQRNRRRPHSGHTAGRL